MKLIIEIPDEYYKFFRDLQYYSSGRRSGRTIERNVINAIKNGTPYNPTGDLTEAEKTICKAYLEDLDKMHTCNEYKLLMNLIDNSQPVCGNNPKWCERCVSKGKCQSTRSQGDCISREALKGIIETYRPALIYNNKTDMKNKMVDYFLDEIDNAQTVEPKRPQGEWKTVKGIDGDEYYECSNCGEPWVLMAGTPKDNNMNFCPNCGAAMKGGAE